MAAATVSAVVKRALPIVLKAAKRYGPTVARAGMRYVANRSSRRETRRGVRRNQNRRFAANTGVSTTSVAVPQRIDQQVTTRRPDTEIVRSQETIGEVASSSSSYMSWLLPLSPGGIAGSVDSNGQAGTSFKMQRLETKAKMYQYFNFTSFGLTFNTQVSTSASGMLEIGYFTTYDAANAAFKNTGGADLTQAVAYSSYPLRTGFTWNCPSDVLQKTAYKRYQFYPHTIHLEDEINNQGWIILRVAHPTANSIFGRLVANYVVTLTSTAMPQDQTVQAGKTVVNGSGLMSELVMDYLNPWVASAKHLGSGIQQLRLYGYERFLLFIHGDSTSAATMSYHEDSNCSVVIHANTASTTKWTFAATIALTNPLSPALFSVQVSGADEGEYDCLIVPAHIRANPEESNVPVW